jgi:hypothetical protein
MNLILYPLIIQKKLSVARTIKPLKFKVRKEIKNHVIKYIQSPILEEEPEFDCYR